MTIYDQEIYAFLAEDRNYQAAREISAKLDDFDQWLCAQFRKVLADALNQSLAGYRSEITESAVYVRKDEWPKSLVVGFDWSDNPDFGLIAPKSEFNQAKVREILESHGINVNSSNSDDVWAWWETLPDYSIRGLEGIVRILPERRAELINRAVAYIESFLSKQTADGKSMMDRIIAEARKI